METSTRRRVDSTRIKVGATVQLGLSNNSGRWKEKKEKTETEKKNGFYSLHDGEAKKKDLFFLFLIKPSLKIGVKCRQSRSNEERRTAFVFQSLISLALMSAGSRSFLRFDC